MSRYPLSVLEGTAEHAFRQVLRQHLPNGGRVLDLTHGTGISWGLPSFLDEDIDLVASDLNPRGSSYVDVVQQQDIFKIETDRKDWYGAFDLVYYDPPWYIDIESDSDDAREGAYGGYRDLMTSLGRYMNFAALPLPLLAKEDVGKIIVKCGDQYHVPTRKLLLHHLDWIKEMSYAMDIVDFYVYRNKRVSPTAFQVKDRPCGVIVHSYFIVGQRRS